MDNLQYIRDAIRQHGNRVQVKVVRWEINPQTGAQDVPYEVSVNGAIALRELSKPVNKRSYSWTRIRPKGDLYVGKTQQPTDQNSLSNPELLSKLKEELKAQLRAEMEAEMAASIVEEDKPKRKKKAIGEEYDIATDATITNYYASDLDNPEFFSKPTESL
jgi:hypothetical protein